MKNSIMVSFSSTPLFLSPPSPLILTPSPPTSITGSQSLPKPKMWSWSSLAANSRARGSVLPSSVPVRVALELLQAGYRYLDIRTVDEFEAGHPKGATNVPYMLKFGSGMMKNPKFLVEVSSAFGKDEEIIIGCQTGKKSLMAAFELSHAGFTGITDIAGGYSVWAWNSLPTDGLLEARACLS